MKTVFEVYNRFERFFVGLVMLLLVVLGFLQVIFRFVLQIPVAWTEELMMFSMVWVAYLGASVAVNERKHIMISMFVDMLPAGLRMAVTLLSQLTWLACSGFMIYLGYHVTMNYVRRGAVTLGGQFPWWAASIIVPVSMLLVSIRVILLMIQTIRGERDTRTMAEIIQEEIAS